MTIKDLVASLLQFNQEDQLLCQVVGTKEGAWNMLFSLGKPEGVTLMSYEEAGVFVLE